MLSLGGDRHCKRDMQVGKNRAILLEQHTLPCTREIFRQRELVLAFPLLHHPTPEALHRNGKCTLTEEPFFLLLGIPPNRNFRPAIFFPFPFFFPSFELLIFFFTPGPGGTKVLLFHCFKSPRAASPDPVLARKWEKKLAQEEHS